MGRRLDLMGRKVTDVLAKMELGERDEAQLVQVLQAVKDSNGKMTVAEFSERMPDEEPEFEGTS